ncbi:MAG: acetate/propionate family kinase [Desulfamplus sp.]
MIVLIINAGSSSLKYQLINILNDSDHTVMASGVVERIGEPMGKLTHKKILTPKNIQNKKAIDNKEAAKEQETLKFIKEQEINDHALAMHLAANMLADNKSGSGVIESINQIDAIGHRVVQGGENFNSSILINDSVKQAIRDNFPLAPLHNPPNLTGIEVAESLFPSIPNIAVFDTEFHHTIPQKAFMYALPYEFYEEFRVRRYGFHGTSHKFVAQKATELISGNKKGLNLITVHLGNGCSICAIENGRCVDTSMGMTPLSGVMMGTRTGDIDPAIENYLIEYANLNSQEIDNIFNKKSGLKGICGMNDMRDIHSAADSGNVRAQLALEMFAYQVKKYIGAYFAVLGSVDGIIFTAGIGENDKVVREMICSNLTALGVEIDPAKNSSSSSEARPIHSDKSAVDVWVVPTNEELQIAREVVNIMCRNNG